jgi:hypothetical protein
VTLLQWLAPPVVGAAIGFITNDIAIRMLFRPLREYRVLGIRVPFTPGIIPRRRRELAEAIGRMVSQELITAETVRTYLQEPRARDSFRSWIGRATAGILDTPLAEVGAASGLSAGSGTLLREVAEGFVASEQFPAAVKAALGAAFESLGRTSIASLAGSAEIGRSVATALVSIVPGGSAGGALWTDAAVAAAARTARAAAPSLAEALVGWLSGPTVRPELERRAQELLSRALDKLNTLQRFLVRAGQYDRRLEEKLPEIVDDAFGQLEAFLSDAALLDALADWVRSQLLRRRDGGEGAAAASSETRDAALDLVAALIEPVVSRPLADSLPALLGGDRPAVLEAVVSRVVDAARRPGALGALANRVSGFASRSPSGASLTVGALLGVGTESKQRIDDAIAARAMELVEAKLTEFLAAFDIRAMVVKRIDALDVADVEKLLVMVIARHLKWINVFGALLGGVIGLGQVLLSLLT